jgi:hypothetical protein
MQDRFNQPCLCSASCDGSSDASSFSIQTFADDAARVLSAPFDRLSSAFGSFRDAREQERLNRIRLG